jgi:uncharacterized protein
MRYDPNTPPDPTAWLELDEQERLLLIERFHRRERTKTPSPKMHAVIHAVVENQIAMTSEVVVHDALARLIREGLDRHAAIHAIGSVLAKHLFAGMKGTASGGALNTNYQADLRELTAARWRTNAEADTIGARPDAKGGANDVAGTSPDAGPEGHAPGSQPLSDAELKQLAEFLANLKNKDALTLEGLDGFFCALIAGPDLIMPSEYLPLVWGGESSDEAVFADPAEANAILSLIMRHWNSIVEELETYTVYELLIGEPDGHGVPGRQWARGFMRGVALRRNAWRELFTNENEGQLHTIQLVAGEIDPGFPPEPLPAETTERLIVWMGAGLGRAYRHFAKLRRGAARASHEEGVFRRQAAKVGRNDPCPCGSGRKFKRCCGAEGTSTTH